MVTLNTCSDIACLTVNKDVRDGKREEKTGNEKKMEGKRSRK